MKETPYTFKVHEIPITKMSDNTIVTEAYCMIGKIFQHVILVAYTEEN